MKVVTPEQTTNNGNGKFVKAILPLVPEAAKEYNKATSVQFELRTEPANDNSPKYKKSVHIADGSESPRDIIQWRKDASVVLTGFNITDNIETATRMIHTITNGSAKTSFDQAMIKLPQAAYDAAMRACTTNAQRNAVV